MEEEGVGVGHPESDIPLPNFEALFQDAFHGKADETRWMVCVAHDPT
jgi:hypothetical protein